MCDDFGQNRIRIIPCEQLGKSGFAPGKIALRRRFAFIRAGWQFHAIGCFLVFKQVFEFKFRAVFLVRKNLM
jgi:hypothetical protein